ncbi:MAG: hypothetical protein DMF62_04980 [Acidobacteria bacterium]|nr:MAG: hypothetical protein DMF62_04980 [Acidobacteriota bacterium]
MKTKVVIEYERTCRRDNTVWYVPQEFHDKPKDAIMMSRGGETAARKGALTVAWIEARRCPICGSISFDEREVKEAS